MDEQKFFEIFNYVFEQSYKKIDVILDNKNIAEMLTESNNNYYKRMCSENPQMDNKIIKCYCFTIIYMLALTTTFGVKNDTDNKKT